MHLDDLKKLNEEFAHQSKLMNEEFLELFQKWMKKDPRMALINTIHLPLNICLNLFANDNSHASNVFPEFPDMFIRFMKPFEFLRKKWGKIPDKEFVEEYTKLYQSQFDDFFPSNKDKENFQNWYKSKNTKK